MEDSVFDYAPLFQMFHDDPLEKRGSHPAIPYPFWIHDNYRTTCANTKARSLAALHSRSAKQQPFPLQKRSEQ